MAATRGIPEGRLHAIAEEWNRRMSTSPEVVQQYSDLYQEAMREAGIEAPDITLEQYADILRRSGSEPLEKVLPEYGLTVQTFAMVSGQWVEKMRSDPSVAAQLGQILGGTTG